MLERSCKRTYDPVQGRERLLLCNARGRELPPDHPISRILSGTFDVITDLEEEARQDPTVASNVNGYMFLRRQFVRGAFSCAFDLLEEAEGIEGLEYYPLFGLPGYIVKGFSHIVAAAPKTGKTEFLLNAGILDWLALGVRVLYLTEEPMMIWLARLREKEAKHLDRFLLLSTCEGPEPATLLGAARLCHYDAPYDILVLDTIRPCLGFIDENDNAAVAAAITPWIDFCRERKITLVALHHTRKTGGQYGEAIAGGHAILGSFDMALEIVRSKRNPFVREVYPLGRVIAPSPFSYRMISDGAFRLEERSVNL